MARQAIFKDDGTITDVPTKLGENPQLEKQADLFQFGKDTENLARLEDEPEQNDPMAAIMNAKVTLLGTITPHKDGYIYTKYNKED